MRVRARVRALDLRFRAWEFRFKVYEVALGS